MGDILGCWGIILDPEKKKITNEILEKKLTENKTAINIAVLFHVVILITWTIFSVIAGFATPDNTDGSPNAVSRIGWWLAAEWVVVVFSIYATGFSVAYYQAKKAGAYAKGAIDWLLYHRVVVVLAIGLNFAHIVLSFYELGVGGPAASTLVKNSYGILALFISMLFFVTVLEVILLILCYAYRANLRFADIVIMVKVASSASSASSLDDEPSPPKRFEDTKTPLLMQLNRHGYNKTALPQ